MKTFLRKLTDKTRDEDPKEPPVDAASLLDVFTDFEPPEDGTKVLVAWELGNNRRTLYLHLDPACINLAEVADKYPPVIGATDVRHLVAPARRTRPKKPGDKAPHVCGECSAGLRTWSLIRTVLEDQDALEPVSGREQPGQVSENDDRGGVARHAILQAELESRYTGDKEGPVDVEKWMTWVSGQTTEQLRKTGRDLIEWDEPMVAVFGSQKGWISFEGTHVYGFNWKHLLGEHAIHEHGPNEAYLCAIVPRHLAKNPLEPAIAVDETFNISHLKLAGDLYNEALKTHDAKRQFVGKTAWEAAHGEDFPEQLEAEWRQGLAAKAVETARLCLQQ